MVTAATREEDILRGFGLGADDYVTKPFNPRELIARCEWAIRNRAYPELVASQVTHPSRRIGAGN